MKPPRRFPVSDVTIHSALAALDQISRDLDRAGDVLAEWERKAVKAREDYTLAYNTAYLRSTGPIPERKALAENNTHAERFAAEATEAEVRIWRTKVRILERRAEVGRSNVGVLRVESAVTR